MNSGKTRCFHDNRFKRRALSEIVTQDCFFNAKEKNICTCVMTLWNKDWTMTMKCISQICRLKCKMRSKWGEWSKQFTGINSSFLPLSQVKTPIEGYTKLRTQLVKGPWIHCSSTTKKQWIHQILKGLTWQCFMSSINEHGTTHGSIYFHPFKNHFKFFSMKPCSHSSEVSTLCGLGMLFWAAGQTETNCEDTEQLPSELSGHCSSFHLQYAPLNFLFQWSEMSIKAI